MLKEIIKKKFINKQNTSLYLSAKVCYGTATIGNNRSVHKAIKKELKLCKKSKLVGGWPVGYLQGMEDLNLGVTNRNPSSSTVKKSRQPTAERSPCMPSPTQLNQGTLSCPGEKSYHF